MVRGSPCMCMATQPAPVSAATPQSEAEMSLISVAPAATRGAGDVGLDGVDRDADAGGGQGLDDRDDPGQLLVGGDRARARAGGLAADVDHVGALGGHGEAVGDGVLEGVVEAAVGEGVRRDVEDPHDERPPGGAVRSRAPGSVGPG